MSGAGRECHVGDMCMLIRGLSEDDLRQVYELLLKEEWDYTREALSCIYSSQPTALIGGFTRDGQLIGMYRV